MGNELKWKSVGGGRHVSGEYALERGNSVSNDGWVSTVYRVFFRDEKIGEVAYFSDAKRAASAHSSQLASGIL